MKVYRLDASSSRFTAHVSTSGLLSAFGHSPIFAIRRFGGDVQFKENKPETVSLLVIVKLEAIQVMSGVSEKDREEIERSMRDQVLEVTKYPEAIFQSVSVAVDPVTEVTSKTRIEGMLTLHGVTRRCPIEAEVTFTEGQLRARGDFSLRQSDYQIDLYSVAMGALKVKDEVKMSFEIAGFTH